METAKAYSKSAKLLIVEKGKEECMGRVDAIIRKLGISYDLTLS